LAESPPSLPAVVGGTPQLNFDALNVRLAAIEAVIASVIASSEKGLLIIRGGVEQGASDSILQGSGFTVSHKATGETKVSFTAAFSGIPTVIPTARLFSNKANATSAEKGSVIVGVNVVGGSATNGTFDFIAIGPR